MQRQYKFRAWDKEFKKFSKIALGYSINDIQYLTDYEWSQYTGLKDKNGKEIYENDIIGFMDGLRLIGYIEFVDCKFQIRYINIKGFPPKVCGDWLKCYEIVGNAWENPEMLEVSHE